MAEPIELFTPRTPDYGSYEQHLLEQYRLYVEMADRIAARRHTANTFFLTSNTAFVSFIALTWAKDTGFSLRIALVFVAVAGAALCWTWYLLVRAYRDLSTGKFAVIHKIESGFHCDCTSTNGRSLAKERIRRSTVRSPMSRPWCPESSRGSTP